MNRSQPSTELRTVVVDGHRQTYRELGPASSSVILLVHGLMSDGSTWARPAAGLAEAGFRVIVPDLLGHGGSDKPADGEYHLPYFADSLHRLLIERGASSVTVVGHSLGGAIAMQLTHDHTELVHRLVLVSAGGLGRKVHPMLRVASLPGAHRVLRLVVNERTAALYRAPRLHRSLRLSPDAVSNLSRAGRGLVSATGRTAFFLTLRNVITPSGQRGSMREHGYLPRELPTLIVWSRDDPILPVEHAYQTHAYLPNSQLVVLPGSTHQPHHYSADRFVQAVAEFVTGNPAPAEPVSAEPAPAKAVPAEPASAQPAPAKPAEPSAGEPATGAAPAATDSPAATSPRTSAAPR